MLKTMNTMGIFKNDDIWFPTYYTYNTAWNYSDASESLAKVNFFTERPLSVKQNKRRHQAQYFQNCLCKEM